MTFSQVGLVASSWSASQTFAPEFSALIVILRSVGPVISTRRSSSPGPAPATRQVGSVADVRGLGAGSAGRGRSRHPLAAALPGGSRSCRRAGEPVVQLGEEGERLRREDLVVAGHRASPGDLEVGVVLGGRVGVGVGSVRWAWRLLEVRAVVGTAVVRVGVVE